MSRQTVPAFKRYVVDRGIAKWIIASDFCIADRTRFNDVFVYFERAIFHDYLRVIDQPALTHGPAIWLYPTFPTVST